MKKGKLLSIIGAGLLTLGIAGVAFAGHAYGHRHRCSVAGQRSGSAGGIGDARG
jgi:hypothetical protein